MYVDRIARILRRHRYAQFADVLGSFKEVLTDMRYPCAICKEGIIKISPRFFNQFTIKQQTFALMHELCHYIFWHFRYAEKGCDLLKSNIACDAVINNQLLSGKLISLDLLDPIKGAVTNEVFTKHQDLADRVWLNYFKHSCCWGFSEERLNSDIAYKYMVELEKEKQAKRQSLKKELREMFTSQQKEQSGEESNQDFDEQESELNDVDTESDFDEDFDNEDSQSEDFDEETDFDTTDLDNFDSNDLEDTDSENYEDSDFEDDENGNPEEGSETDNDLDAQNDFTQGSGSGSQNSSDYNNTQDDMPDSEEDLNSEFDLGSNTLPGQEYEEGFEGWDESMEQRINAQLKNEKHIDSMLEEMENKAVKNKDVDTLNKCFSQRELIAPREQVNWQVIFKQAVLKGSAFKKEYSFARPNRHNLSIQRASHSRAQLPNNVSTRPLPSVHVFVDTSGSVEDYQLSRVLYEVQQVFKVCSCFDLEVTSFNDRLGSTCVSKAGSHFNISNFNFSRGGTLFCPIWDLYFKNGKKQPDICIIITDGIPNDRDEWTKCCKMIGKRTIFVTNQEWFTPPEPKMEVIYRKF